MITILMRKILGGYNYKYAITLAPVQVMIDSNPMINGRRGHDKGKYELYRIFHSTEYLGAVITSFILTETLP